MISTEQMCRDLLTQAIKDEIVAPSEMWANSDPQCRSSGELCGMANLLSGFLNEFGRELLKEMGEK